MPELTISLPDGPIEIALYDGGHVREHTWHVKDKVVHVAEKDIEFFTSRFPEAVGNDKPKENPSAKESGKATK